MTNNTHIQTRFTHSSQVYNHSHSEHFHLSYAAQVCFSVPQTVAEKALQPVQRGEGRARPQGDRAVDVRLLRPLGDRAVDVRLLRPQGDRTVDVRLLSELLEDSKAKGYRENKGKPDTHTPQILLSMTVRLHTIWGCRVLSAGPHPSHGKELGQAAQG